MSLASLIGIDKERYDQGNKFLSQDPYLQSYQAKAPITFNMSSPVNTGIMGPKIFPYPIIPQGDGGDGGGGIINTKDPYGYTGPGSSKSIGGFNIDDIGEGTIDEEDIITGTNLTKGQLAKAYGSYLYGGPFMGAFSVYRSNKANEQAEIDKINQDIALQYGSLGGIGAEEAQRRQDDAGGSVQQSEDYGSYGGKGDVGATGANFSGDFATDSASYDLAEGGRVGYSNGGLSKYEIFKLGELGYNTKGGTVLEPFGGIKVLRDILKVNKYADGGIVGLYI